MVADKKKIIKVDIFSISKGLLVSSDNFNISRSFKDGSDSYAVMVKSPKVVLVKKGTPVQVILYYVNGDRVKYDTAVDVCTEYQLNATIGTQNTVLEERRRYYKLDTDLKASIALLSSGGEDVVFDNPVMSKIKNINIGGVFIQCRTNFKMHDTIFLSFNVLGEELNLPAEVLRIQRKGKVIEGYGCAFVKLKTKEEEILARYINMVQRESLDIIKKKLNSR